MPGINIVFESPRKWHRWLIKSYLKRGFHVWVIEPFYAYQHKKAIRFYPSPLPDFIDNLVKKGKINLLTVDQLNAREIYHLAADNAVKTIESVYPEHKKGNKDLFENICKVLKSAKAEDIFKKNLCDRLGEFYSVNILLHRIEKLFGHGRILVYPDSNVRDYRYLETLLSRSKQDYFKYPNTRFPLLMYVIAFIENLKEGVVVLSKLFAQTLASGLLSGFWKNNQKDKKSYLYGITVASPSRQLADNQRGPDLIIDGNKIKAEDVVAFPLVDLTGDQKKRLTNLPCAVHYPPKAGQCFSHFTKWAKLLWLALRKSTLCNKSEEIKTACIAFFYYFKWLKVLENLTFRHFITHCDFGLGHIGRNLALNQSGIDTWYFTDSMNQGCNWKGQNGSNGIHHPFWTYMYYNHLVTWDDLLAQYFKDFPGSSKQYHVVGCLWSGHIIKKSTDKECLVKFNLKSHENDFVIVAFDSSYSRNGFTSYTEGIAFAEHLMELANTCPDIYILFKEKRKRNIHYIIDPICGPELLDLYNKMDAHPRVAVCNDQVDVSELISASDMIISFPFTSTTFEALSVNMPAIWHDPMGYYKNTPYGEIGGVTTHSYEELKTMVLKLMEIKPGAYQNPIPENSILMDPYRDGKAIDRFRELLHSSDMKHYKQPVYTY
ncbi:MAG: polysaccharide biosynthesis PFTS motif protein [Candidatus Scalindua sp.]|jgi:hypothetical protein|nr:polysaccharide biosynthesis PFTS motif protein [Candidatus Scalindua sp.]MBT6229419.1 polysaccharide biosynthesis PFTS motif protein [Candidatus Scalindua sp.]MBT6563741.1 polysaccharide biosynthesis PFTS motif protein [Candidatus Scalindua sp.]